MGTLSPNWVAIRSAQAPAQKIALPASMLPIFMDITRHMLRSRPQEVAGNKEGSR